MNITKRFINADVWNKLPKEAQAILMNNHFEPFPPIGTNSTCIGDIHIYNKERDKNTKTYIKCR